MRQDGSISPLAVDAVRRVRTLLEERRAASASGISKPWARYRPASLFRGALRRFQARRRGWMLLETQRVLHGERLVVSLPAFRGSFELPLRGNLTRRLLQGSFEHERVVTIETALREGMHVLDVGANLGLYTVLASRLVGESGCVLAVEPVQSCLRSLALNVLRNRLRNVLTFHGVATAAPGTFSIEYVEDAEEYSSMAGIVHPDVPSRPRQRATVPGDTLDNLAAKHNLQPALVKIDTEGAEELVLTGARSVLEEYRPVIISELDDRLLGSFNRLWPESPESACRLGVPGF